MEMAQTDLVLCRRGQAAHIEATRIRFSAHQCFARDGGASDRRCLRLLTDHLSRQPGLALALDGDTDFLSYILECCPHFRDAIRCLIVEAYDVDGSGACLGLPLVTREEIPSDVETIFLCATRAFPRLRMRRWLPPQVRVIDPDILPELAMDQVPAQAWVPWSRDLIYPLDLPDIEFQPGLDLLVIDCPARNLGLMPNGLGYVHNALKQVDVRFQTCDVDILLYHRFHLRRLLDEGGQLTLPGGRALPTDPWQAEHYDLWTDDEVIAFFTPEIDEVVAKVVAARPKVLGLSIHGCNEKFSAKVVARVKAALPDLIVLVGGYSCYSPDIGLRGFPLADYMCIGEADLTVGPLAQRLARGERPGNLPGVLSRFDTPATPFLPAPMVHDLDLLDHPRYEWLDLQIYRNYNGYQLTPIIASRGCRWSRCTFCAERFYWRIRSASAFVDEVEWLIGQGCRLFMFNESDLNGKPEAVLEICDEILRRGLQIKLTGQLRIHKKCDRAYFQKLRRAGFVALRFGIDAFSENTLRLQKKGYTTATVCQNLKDCWEAGIFSEVNWVIGVPGETEQDIDESIELILQNKPYIGRLANINPLILATGGVYWMEPEKHNIHFRGSKEEIYATYPRAIPAHLWYSTEPYIDEKVRKQRFERIVLALHEGQFHVGAWANRIIEDVKHNRDRNRAGPRAAESDACATPHRARMNAGVGGMEQPEPPVDDALEFNADARSAAYVFRAGSSLPEDKTCYFRSHLHIVSYKGELFGIQPDAWESQFGKAAGKADAVTVDRRGQYTVSVAKTRKAVPELLQAVGSYNIVAYDSRFYGVPQVPPPALSRQLRNQLRDNGSHLHVANRPYLVRLLRTWARIVLNAGWRLLGRQEPAPTTAIPWGDVDLDGLPGVVVGTRLAQVIEAVEKILGLAATQTASADGSQVRLPTMPLPRSATRPKRVGTVLDHDIVEYEGWFYGMPHALGAIDLAQVDVIEMPGVIRDLSREVVEGEIRELAKSLAAPYA